MVEPLGDNSEVPHTKDQEGNAEIARLDNLPAFLDMSENSLDFKTYKQTSVATADSSVMGIRELGKHVPITPGIPSLGVVPGRVPDKGLFIGRSEVVLRDDSEYDLNCHGVEQS